MSRIGLRNALAGLAGLALVALLAACVLLPGRFTSDLVVQRDGTFSFRYVGEIVLMPLAQPASGAAGVSRDETEEQFVEETCAAASGESRPCTARELADQRSAWQAERARRKRDKNAEDLRNAKAMAAFMGGIDPTDPRAAQEFAARLARQQGWTSVVSKGNGRFEVAYEAAGRLDHDFTFPSIERLPLVLPFVTVIRRKDGTVRIDAPAFAPGAGNAPLPGLIDAASPRNAPVTPEGQFTLRTDGQVLANNTDEGPKADAKDGQRLSWKIDARTAAAPTALVRLAQ